MTKLAADCLVLAGGRAQRLGGVDKGLLALNGRPLIEYVLERTSCMTDRPIISANRNRASYLRYSRRAIGDSISGFQGPLAGIYSALKYMKHDYLFVMPCDTPFLPADLFQRLRKSMEKNNRPISVVKHGSQIEPLLMLIKKTHITGIANHLDSGQHSVIGWIEGYQCSYAEFSPGSSCFLNINSRDDLAMAEKLIADSADTASTDTKDLLLTPVLQ